MLADPHVRVPLLRTTQQPGLTVSRLCFVCRLHSTCSMLVAAAGSTSWRCSPLSPWHQMCVWLCGCVISGSGHHRSRSHGLLTCRHLPTSVRSLRSSSTTLMVSRLFVSWLLACFSMTLT